MPAIIKKGKIIRKCAGEGGGRLDLRKNERKKPEHAV